MAVEESRERRSQVSSVTHVPFKDLESRGFVVIRSFLSSEELDAFRADFANQPLADNQNYRVKSASHEANLRLLVRVKEVLAEVTARTDLRVDAPQGASYFSNDKKTGINFYWHQDHESFFATQNHYDYLNFYIPIVKPSADKSNLSIVPFDALEKASPAMCRTLVRSGATSFIRFGNWPLMIHDDEGRIRRLTVDLDRIALTPHLAAGDLLLLRGDVVHRTQDAETARVAISFRASSLHAVVSRTRLARGGLKKADMMANNSATYQRMFNAFDASGKDEMSVIELGRAMSRLPAVVPSRRRDFMKFLIRQKLRSRVLLPFVVSAASTSALDMLKRAAKLYDRRVGAGR